MNDQDKQTRHLAAEGYDWTGLAQVVRPTLIVAVGGTGSTAAKIARERIDSMVGPQHHYVEFRVFDTAYQDNREPRFVDNAEYVYLGGFNAQAVISDIVAEHAYPHWAKWLPPRLNFQQVAFGAGGIRPIGRLCYFYRRDRVEAAVQQALTNITDADAALRFHQKTGVRVNLEAGIDIHVICSVCGGTGSGMFLDLAFDLRQWAEEHTDREVSVTGHLVLPEAFRNKPVVLTALEANAYVALQELDRYMNASSDDPWRVEHLEGRLEESWRAPFDHCYLLSGLQQGGTSDIETLTSVIGEAVTQLTLSQVGQRVSEGVINMAGQRKSTRDRQGRLCCYSSYGILGLEIPWDLLGESLGPELAREVHHRLASQERRSDENLKPELRHFRDALDLDVERPEQLIPSPQIDTATVVALIEELGNKSSLPRRELQSQLRRNREAVQQQAQRTLGEELWSPQRMRDYLGRKIATSLLSEAGNGLGSALHLLDACRQELEKLQHQLRNRSVEAEEAALKARSDAQAVERESLGGKEWEKQIWPEVERWEKQVQHEARSRIYAAQAQRIGDLIGTIEHDLIRPWRQIRTLFSHLRLEQPQDEEAYYRARRALTTIVPLDHFRNIIEPYKHDLIGEVLEELVNDSPHWAELTPKELAERFYRLCTIAIRKHFEGEARIDCDHLLAERYRHPSEDYNTEINVFLRRARANWELDESYSLRTNLLEISALGAREDSTFYQSLSRSNHHISAVDEQRRDYVPILRTEHGLSLMGLKRLDDYRESLVKSVVHEQRYDLHFFLDRRWITRVEFADEKRGELRTLYLFSTAEMLDWIQRQTGTGYVLRDEVNKDLGRYRRAAYRQFQKDKALQRRLEEKIQEKEGDEDWPNQLRGHIERLQQRIAKATSPGDDEDSTVAPPRYLSLDIYQIHSEIRAVRAELRIEDLGI